MPEFDSATRTKINALRARYATQEAIDTFELIKIAWPAPTEDIYYSVLQTDEITTPAPSVSPIVSSLIPEGYPEWFVPVAVGASIGDEEVKLTVWDADGAFADLLVLHGEGIKVELFYWFPQEELLLPYWQGHLRNEEEALPSITPFKVVQGFRSSEGTLPSRAHYTYCDAVFGGLLETQPAIDEHGCPYNLHIGGGVGNNDPDTGEPWTFCNRLNHASCTARAVNSLYHLSHNAIQKTIANGQTHGPLLYSTTVGNQSNLKEPVAVVMGVRRVSGFLIAYRRDLNNNHPEDGWFAGIYEMSEGPIVSFSNWKIILNNTEYKDPYYYRYRLGEFGQTAVDTQLQTHGYSHTALIKHHSGWIDPSTVDVSQATATAVVTGLRNIRVYSDEDTYSEIYSTNRVWQIARMLCDKVWGYGLDYDRLSIPSFIAAATWCDEYVRFTDTNGDYWDHQRSSSNVELRGKKVQQQIEDMCRAGRLSTPFLFDGKIHIVPLRALTTEELAACPIFTDTGEDRNICVTGEKGSEVSTLTISRNSDLNLPNKIEITIDLAADDWIETPMRPVEDVTAQLRAGRVVGDKARKINSKRFNLLGVTDEAQAMKMAWALLDLGEFDGGGLKNNLELKMTIWYLDSLELHPEKVIKVVSSRLTRYGFTYFRVKEMARQSDLRMELKLQAYNVAYMNYFEVLLSDIVDEDYPLPPGVPPGPVPGDPEPSPPDYPSPEPNPCILQLGAISHLDGVLSVEVRSCPL